VTGARGLHVVIPGDLETRTGGYEYDRRIVAGLRARGWAVRVMTLPGNYPFPTDEERAAARATLRTIPDAALVLADGLAFGALPSEAREQRQRLRLIALVHHPLAAETGLSSRDATVLSESEGQALQAARGVVVTSPRTVEAVEAFGIDRARIAVVEPGTGEAPAAAGSGGSGLQLLCVASVVPRKGHDTLIEALASLTSLPWHLTCVGSVDRDRTWTARLRQQVEARGLDGRVTFAGELEGAALDAAYHSADLFVLPTRYEGYGMAVAEALARGIPVVSTDTGAIVELVGDRAGVLVPPDNVESLAGELKRLLTDAGDFARLKRGALAARSKRSTWESATARMEEALTRLGDL
jgi:glycosyltransferase involved in cell wall biosynthesis